MDKNTKEIMKAIKMKNRILKGRDLKTLIGSFDGEKIKEIDRYIALLGGSTEEV